MNKETTKCSLTKVIVLKCVRVHFVLSSFYLFTSLLVYKGTAYGGGMLLASYMPISVTNLGDMLMEHIRFLCLAK